MEQMEKKAKQIGDEYAYQADDIIIFEEEVD